MTARTLFLVLLVPILFLVLRRRIRLNFGRQRMGRPGPMVLGIALLLGFGTGLLLAARDHPYALASGTGGLAIGAALGVVGLRMTRFESNREGSFYTPNNYIGAAFVVALIGTLTYRFAFIGAADRAAVQQSTNSTPLTAFQGSPITLFLITTLIGYSAAFLVGLFRTFRKHKRTWDQDH